MTAQLKPETEDKAPELTAAIDCIRNGKTEEACRRLEVFVKSGTAANHDLLKAYGQLIRLAGESRHLEKVPPYIEAIKAIPIRTPLEKSCFAECLYSIGVGWLYLGAEDKAVKNLNESMALAQETGNEKLCFYIRISLLEHLRHEGKYAQILEELPSLEASPVAQASPLALGSCYIMRGDILRKQGLYREARDAYDKAREIYAANKNSPWYHYTLWALGTCYAALEDKERATIYLELASHNSESLEFWRINILSNLTLAELYAVSGDYELAQQVYSKVQEQVGSDENSYYGKRLLRGLALLRLREGEYPEADELIDRLVVVAVRDKSQSEIMRLRLLKAEILIRSGEAAQQEEARAMLQEAHAYYSERNILRHKGVALELMARLDSSSGYPQDALKKVLETLEIARASSFDRLYLRAALAKIVLQRKLGQDVTPERRDHLEGLIHTLNARAERVIMARFDYETYDDWSTELRRLDPHSQRFVNEFFDDFHFVPKQSIDMEIDRNSNYVREKHLGEIPFHNKFTLMRILCLLAETPGREFSKEELAKEIWGQEYNPLRHDNNIYININRLRKLLEPNPRESRYIMNGSRGYYFNPSMKVNISSRISDVAPRTHTSSKEKAV